MKKEGNGFCNSIIWWKLEAKQKCGKYSSFKTKMCEESLLKINIEVFEQEGNKDVADLGINSDSMWPSWRGGGSTDFREGELKEYFYLIYVAAKNQLKCRGASLFQLEKWRMQKEWLSQPTVCSTWCGENLSFEW